MNEIELKQLYREINSGQRKLKDEEVDMLMSMFWDKFGNAMYGMALNPLFLLDDEENPLNSLSFSLSSEEEEKINKWNEKDIEHDFDEIEVKIPELDIKLLCGTPNKCKPRVSASVPLFRATQYLTFNNFEIAFSNFWT